MAEVPFEGWASMNGPALKRVAVLICGDDHVADDLVQDALIKLLTRWRRLPEPGLALDAYARRIMVNSHISAWRRRRREEAKRHLVAAAHGVHDSDAIDDRSQLFDLLAGLGRRQRAALVLRYYCDLDDAAIADALGCSEATVRSQISRALTHLRQDAPHGARTHEED